LPKTARAGPPDAPVAPLRASYLELRLREALRDRVAELLRRAVARPPFAPAFLTEGLRLRAVVLRADDVLRAVVFFRAPPVLRADVLRAVAFLRPPVLRADVLRAVVFLRAPPVLRADDLRAVVFFRAPPVLRADVLRAVVLRADDLRAVVFFRAPPVLRADVLRAVVFRAVVLRAVVLRADDLRAVVFFRAPPVLRAVVLRAAVLRVELVLLAVFLRAELVLRLLVLRAAVLRLEPPDLLREDPERELLLDERAEERVVAGTATARAASAPSSIDASPMAESPHVSSATSLPIDVSLGESALDV
jgi:hypothetical protein